MASGPAARRLQQLETVLLTLDAVVELGEMDRIMARIAQGFCDIGAIMTVLLEHTDGHLRVTARWPEEGADALYARLKGGRFLDFTIPVSRRDNNYVHAFVTRTPLFLAGPTETVDHLLRTFALDESARPALAQALDGRAGAVLPLVAGSECLGVVGLNYRDTLRAPDLGLFNVFATSAATLLAFKRSVISREAIHAENLRLVAQLESALAQEKQTRQELARAERLAALGEMSAVVAHEIRNPLGVIANCTGTLSRRIGHDAETRILLGIVAEETQRINRIVGDLLAFSSPMSPNASRHSPAELAERAVFLACQDRSYGEHIAVRRDIAPDLPDIMVDPHLVTQALVNLLQNAFHAMPEGGTATVRAERVDATDRAAVRIAVRDTGDGIPPDEVDLVFKPFFTTRATGTGLGLAIVKRVVDSHSADISIATSPGGGTEVRIDFPPAEDE